MGSIQFSPHFALALRADGTQRMYDVTLTHSAADGEETVLKFIVRRRLMAKAEAGVFLCELLREPVAEVDETGAGIDNDILDDLAARCGAVLYPVRVRLHHAGHALGLAPDPALAERWASQKPGLQQYFRGEAADAYIAAMDRQVHSPQKLSDMVCESLFFQAFFAPVYQPYGERPLIEGTLYYKAMPVAPSVAFGCGLRVEPETGPAGGPVVTITGRCTDERSGPALLAGALPTASVAGDPPVAGDLHLTYQLLPSTHALHRLDGRIELYEGEGEEAGPRLVAGVDIAIVHRPGEDVVNIQPLPVVSMAEPKKKSRWHFF